MVVTGLRYFNFIFLTLAASQGSMWRNMFAKQKPRGNRREGTQTNPTRMREGEGGFQKGLKLLETREPLRSRTAEGSPATKRCKARPLKGLSLEQPRAGAKVPNSQSRGFLTSNGPRKVSHTIQKAMMGVSRVQAESPDKGNTAP